MEQLLGRQEVEKQIAESRIRIVPIQFMRSRTFCRSFIIVDECQNLTDRQTIMVMSRLGKDSKMVLCGDVKQIDLRGSNKSGLRKIHHIAQEIPEVGYIELLHNHRHPLVDKLLGYYEEENTVVNSDLIYMNGNNSNGQSFTNGQTIYSNENTAMK